MARLLVAEGPDLGRFFELARDRAILGSGVGNDIVLSDPEVAYRQAEILFDGEVYSIRNLAPTTPFALNGSETTEAMLSEGDVVAVGATLLYFEEVAETEESEAEAEPLAPSPLANVPEAPGMSRATSSSRISLDHTTPEIHLRDDPPSNVEKRQRLFDHTGEIVRAWEDRSGHEALDRRLATLYQIAAAVGAQIEVGTLLDQVLEVLMDEIPAERALILLWDEQQKALTRGAVKHRHEAPRSGADEVSRTILAEVLSRRESMLVVDASMDERFSGQGSVTNLRLRSILVSPLMAGRDLIGFLHLDSRRAGGIFSEEDLELLTAVALLVSNAMERLRLLEVRREKERMAEEVRRARIVQDILLPCEVPSLDGYNFAVKGSISGDLGGDYYDFIPMSDGKLALVMGDVSGHDIASALVMSMVRAVLRSQCRIDDDPSRILRATNEVVEEDTPTGMYLTLFLGILDPVARTLHYSNAGHPYPVLVRSHGVVEHLKTGGIPIGLHPNVSYQGDTTTLEEGDLLVLYTDGLLEVPGADGEFFGQDRLTATLVERASATPTRLVDTVLHRVQTHLGQQRLEDDVAIMVVRVGQAPRQKPLISRPGS